MPSRPARPPRFPRFCIHVPAFLITIFCAVYCLGSRVPNFASCSLIEINFAVLKHEQVVAATHAPTTHIPHNPSHCSPDWSPACCRSTPRRFWGEGRRDIMAPCFVTPLHPPSLTRHPPNPFPHSRKKRTINKHFLSNGIFCPHSWDYLFKFSIIPLKSSLLVSTHL